MEQVASIKERIPRGVLTKIADKAGVSVRTVNRVLAGQSDNIEVLHAIADVLREERKARAAAQKKLEKAFF